LRARAYRRVLAELERRERAVRQEMQAMDRRARRVDHAAVRVFGGDDVLAGQQPRAAAGGEKLGARHEADAAIPVPAGEVVDPFGFETIRAADQMEAFP